MSTIEDKVVQHYTGKPIDNNSKNLLLTQILNALDETGFDSNNLQPEDLAPVEEFHIGGRKATEYAVSKMSLKPDQHILDIGCGIGGAARFIASQKGCKVSGIDLTPEYVNCGNELTRRVKLDDNVKLEVASALDMPFPNHAFDAAITLHVAMNIEDRKSLYQEISRVLKSGSVFCVFDVMQKSEEALDYPVPWANTPETSFLKTPEQTQMLLEEAGFHVQFIEDRAEIAKKFFKQQMQNALIRENHQLWAFT